MDDSKRGKLMDKSLARHYQLVLVFFSVGTFLAYFLLSLVIPILAYSFLIIATVCISSTFLLESVPNKEKSVIRTNFSNGISEPTIISSREQLKPATAPKKQNESEKIIPKKQSNSTIITSHIKQSEPLTITDEEQPNLPTPTAQAIKLSEALTARGILNELEHWDGYKHVDIFIPEANLAIEVDGKYHFTESEHLERDSYRDLYSQKDGIYTKHIPNDIVDEQLEKLANGLAEFARKRQR